MAPTIARCAASLAVETTQTAKDLDTDRVSTQTRVEVGKLLTHN